MFSMKPRKGNRWMKRVDQKYTFPIFFFLVFALQLFLLSMGQMRAVLPHTSLFTEQQFPLPQDASGSFPQSPFREKRERICNTKLVPHRYPLLCKVVSCWFLIQTPQSLKLSKKYYCCFRNE